MGSQKAEESESAARQPIAAREMGASAPVCRDSVDSSAEALPASGGGMVVDECAALTVESLIRDHYAALYRYAYRLTGSQCDAEDLVQQAFLIAVRKLEQVREPEHVTAWLYSVLRSCFLKGCRKAQPQTAGQLELNLDQIHDTAPSPEGIDRDELQQALDELPDDYKLVLVMFYFDHYSYKQIAEQLELPIGTVMSRLARAKQRLRARLSSA